MKKNFLPPWLLLIFFFGLALAARAQTSFEIGALAGGAAYRNAGVTSGSTSGSVGFKPGFSVGGFLGQSMSDHLGGELRYLYSQNDLKLSSGGSEATFSGRSHLIHYDLMVYAAGRQSHVRPYVAGGGGLKFYQGAGTEQAFQTLSKLALLTKTNEALPTVDFGGGVKIQAAGRMMFHLEFRDYITKVPKIFAAAPGAKISGIFHQWMPAVGISWAF
ncbi:MAG: outer membrane beta-barrel protein [Acidobacteria bacterium]|nr:outer membrane beta-barrel protein [Acidobacteriota bacterium]